MSPVELTAPRLHSTGAALVIVSSILWGCSPLLCRTAAQLSSTPLPATRQTLIVLAAMTLVLVPLAARHRRATTTTTTTRRLALLGITDALNTLCFLAAIAKTSIAVAVLCHSAAPLLVATFAPVVLRERRVPGTWLALGLAVVGIVFVLQPWTTARPDDVIGAALGLLSAVFYALSVFIGKGLGGERGDVEIAGWPKLVSLPVALVAALVFSGGVDVEVVPCAILVVAGVVCGAVPLLLFYAGLRRLPASQASVFTLVEPLTAVLVGVVALQEPMTAALALGGLLVLGGIALAAGAARRGPASTLSRGASRR